jgi:hypothetical protein
VKETVKQRLADKPAHSIFYSNSGYLMAGAMLEKIRNYERKKGCDVTGSVTSAW